MPASRFLTIAFVVAVVGVACPFPLLGQASAGSWVLGIGATAHRFESRTGNWMGGPELVIHRGFGGRLGVAARVYGLLLSNNDSYQSGAGLDVSVEFRTTKAGASPRVDAYAGAGVMAAGDFSGGGGLGPSLTGGARFSIPSRHGVGVYATAGLMVARLAETTVMPVFAIGVRVGL